MEIKEQELRLTYKFLQEKHPEIIEELAKYVMMNLKDPNREQDAPTLIVSPEMKMTKEEMKRITDNDKIKKEIDKDYVKEQLSEGEKNV